MSSNPSTPSIIEIIRQRSSWRKYEATPLRVEDRRRLDDYLPSLPPAPFTGLCRFRIVEAFKSDPAQARRLGTYGSIHGATTFIVGAVTRGHRDLELYGFQMENIILFATSLGLGTCWLGGTFNRSGFGQLIGIQDGETIPAVSPVGYAPVERSVRDRLVRWSANSKNRFDWDRLFFESTGAPLAQEQAGPYATVLEMVRLAPSASNKQPWRIFKESGRPIYHFFLERTTIYNQMAKALTGEGWDIQRLDMGIAVCHFERAAQALNLEGHWDVCPPQGPTLSKKMEYLISWVGK